MSRRIVTNDNFSLTERQPYYGVGLVGEVIFGSGLHRNHYTDIYGNNGYKLSLDKVEYISHNIIPIGGYQFAFEKLFNIGLDQESNLKVGDLNDERPGMKIGVPKSIYKSTKIDVERSSTDSSFIPSNVVKLPATNAIFGFMVGDGGSAADNMTAIAPNYKNRSLYNPVPFRTVSSKYDNVSDGKYTYFGCTKLANDKYEYYIKRIDPVNSPHIVNTWVADGVETDVDDTVFSSTSTNAIETYVEMGLVIDADDCRSEDMTTAPRVNEIGLVSGWYNAEENDYESIRLFTHFTRPSITLASGDKIEIIYRIYAR